MRIFRNWEVSPAAAGLLGGLLVSGVLLGALLWWFQDDLLLGNIVTAYGILDTGTEALGDKPEILTAAVRTALGLAIFVCAGFAAAAMLDRVYRAREARLARVSSQPQASSNSLRRFALLAIPPCLVYTLAISYRAVVDGYLFDRYLIVLLPALVIPSLWHYQHEIRKPLPSAVWAVVGVLAWYGVATTHDHLAAGRARLQAASALTAAGIPRTRITAGLEYDGWTQAEQTGSVHAGTNAGRTYPVDPGYWFWDFTPSIDPLYFVAYSRLEGLQDTRFKPVRYAAWLPPFRRQVYTQIAGPVGRPEDVGKAP
jgi:hypothetical protein